jgi:hypothetical protein
MQLCRSWYFLPGIALGLSGLAAAGLDHFLTRETRVKATWIGPVALAASAGLIGWDLARWQSNGFAYGWRSGIHTLVALAIFGLAAYSFRWARDGMRAALAAALILVTGVEFKAFGTHNRVNTQPGSYKPVYNDVTYQDMDDAPYREMRAHPDYRVGVDVVTVNPLWMRHAGLSTPQGFDPFLPDAYRSAITQAGGKFVSDRLFELDPDRDDLLQLLGIRYVISGSNGTLFPRLTAHSKFRLLQPATRYFHVFEYTAARPPYGWESGSGEVEVLEWSAQRRRFRARSGEGGRFTLHEQLLPGWRATVDGRTAVLERWHGAFQTVTVAPGEHLIEFRYHSSMLRAGAWISLVSVIALAIAPLAARRSNKKED